MLVFPAIYKVLRASIFLIGCLGFALFYLHELNPDHEWPPWHYQLIVQHFGKGMLVTINIFIVALMFSGIMIKTTTPSGWAAHGVLAAFLISVITEMFGLPLITYLVSPWLDGHSIGLSYLKYFGHIPITLGIFISLIGLSIIVLGWLNLYFSKKPIVITGLYRYVRHPQYFGLIIFTFGWLLHWPTMTTLLLWPVIVILYLYAARREELYFLRLPNNEYVNYLETTGRFLPKFKKAK